jgi:MraZ protein
MTSFLGRYEFQMDDKGRVSLPSAFRREAEAERFVLLQWEKPNLSLFPYGAWASVQERMLEYRRSGRAAWNTVRQIVSNASEIVPDKQGRILVPSWLKEAASLEGTVLLIGNIDRIDIWNPRLYDEAVREAEGPDTESFTHQVFS